jgi:hypothetical protein
MSGGNVRVGSIATEIDLSAHFRLSLNSGSTEDIAAGPFPAKAGLSAATQQSKRLSGLINLSVDFEAPDLASMAWSNWQAFE